MEYQEILPISRQDASIALNSGDETLIVDALLRLTYHEPNRKWVQEKCVQFALSTNSAIRRIAVLCIGHLARIHKKIDLEIVLPVLEGLIDDPILADTVENTYDDIKMFCEL